MRSHFMRRAPSPWRMTHWICCCSTFCKNSSTTRTANFRSATINVMIDNLDAIALHETRTFTLENDALDMLLFNFLQEFVYYKDSELLLLRAQQVQIEEKDGEYHLSAVTQGEKLDRDRHEERVDVKAVTLHRFQLEKTDDGWTAMVILDI